MSKSDPSNERSKPKVGDGQWLQLPKADADRLHVTVKAHGGPDLIVEHGVTGHRVWLPEWLVEVYRRAKALANADVFGWKEGGAFACGRSASAEVDVLDWMLARVSPETFEASWRLGGRTGLNGLLRDLDPNIVPQICTPTKTEGSP